MPTAELHHDLGSEPLGLRLLGLARAAAALHMAQSLRRREPDASAAGGLAEAGVRGAGISEAGSFVRDPDQRPHALGGPFPEGRGSVGGKR